MKKIRFEDRIKGGADVANLTRYLNRFDPEEVAKGIKVEKEHTKDPDLAAEIASDHFSEDPHYYSKLKKSGIVGESTNVFEFNFFDILEAGFDPDVPLGLQINRSAFAPRVRTGKEIRAERRANKWASISTQMEKDGASINAIRDAKSVFDNAGKGGSATPDRTTPDTHKHLYPKAGRPKNALRQDRAAPVVGGLSKQKFVSMDQLPDTRPRQDSDSED